MHIDPTYILYETEHWLLNHHLASTLPGYLMLGAKTQCQSLARVTRGGIGLCIVSGCCRFGLAVGVYQPVGGLG